MTKGHWPAGVSRHYRDDPQGLANAVVAVDLLGLYLASVGTLVDVADAVGVSPRTVARWRDRADLPRASHVTLMRQHMRDTTPPPSHTKTTTVRCGALFGFWRVLEFAGRSARGIQYWLCECTTCGERSLVKKYNLAEGSTSSCRTCANRRLRCTRICVRGVVYPSITAAAEALGVSRQTIHRWLPSVPAPVIED